MKIEDLSVGQYVRTVDWGIGKIKSIGDIQLNQAIIELDTGYSCWNKDIKSASHNLADILSINDYVNGIKLHRVANSGVLLNEDIKSIVTHEQFEKLAYKVGGDE